VTSLAVMRLLDRRAGSDGRDVRGRDITKAEPATCAACAARRCR
jgi:hypothetical protein